MPSFHAFPFSLITSQIDTAPKRRSPQSRPNRSLITSQIDTAPKPERGAILDSIGLITSQIDTAPKRGETPRAAKSV